MKEVSRLIGDLFGGASPNSDEVQQLADAFAAPLGIVADHEGQYAPVPVEALDALPVISDAFDAAELEKEDFVSISDIYSRMQRAPYGLAREAQHLIMAAFVAGRRFEFVTSSGNRINHRSLDLQIIWDDVIGIAKPSDEICSNERLRWWACLITGISDLGQIETVDGQASIADALATWLTLWQKAGVLQRFDDLSDENLNTRIWRIAANVKKTFELIAASISSMVQNSLPLDQCLQSIADAFSDSEEEFQNKRNDLLSLENFTGAAAIRGEIDRYVAGAENTADDEIETMRQQVLQLVDESYFDSSAATNHELEDLWPRFKKLFSRSRPNPKHLLTLSDEQLRSAGLSRQKMTYLRDLAKHFTEGKIPTRQFSKMTDEEIIQSLIPVKGIGRWTAEMFLIFVLNRTDLLPVDDLGVRKGFQKVYGLRTEPKAAKMMEIAEKWRPWRTVGSWYMWRGVS